MGLVNRVLPQAELLPAALCVRAGHRHVHLAGVGPSRQGAALRRPPRRRGLRGGAAPRRCSSRWCGARTSPRASPPGATGGCPSGPATRSNERTGCRRHRQSRPWPMSPSAPSPTTAPGRSISTASPGGPRCPRSAPQVQPRAARPRPPPEGAARAAGGPGGPPPRRRAGRLGPDRPPPGRLGVAGRASPGGCVRPPRPSAPPTSSSARSSRRARASSRPSSSSSSRSAATRCRPSRSRWCARWSRPTSAGPCARCSRRSSDARSPPPRSPRCTRPPW